MSGLSVGALASACRIRSESVGVMFSIWAATAWRWNALDMRLRRALDVHNRRTYQGNSCMIGSRTFMSQSPVYRQVQLMRSSSRSGYIQDFSHRLMTCVSPIYSSLPATTSAMSVSAICLARSLVPSFINFTLRKCSEQKRREVRSEVGCSVANLSRPGNAMSFGVA